MSSLEQALLATKKAGDKLTKKQKVFVEEYIKPKVSGKEAAKKAYGKPDKPLSERTAEQIAYENLRKPSIKSYLSNYNDIVEESLINVVKDWGREENTRKREIALNNAQYIHDKVHGKATQQIETKQSVVSISIDLTEDSTDNTTGSDLT